MNKQTIKLVLGIAVIVGVFAFIIYLKPIIDLMRSGATTGPSLILSPASFSAVQGDVVTVDIMLDTSGANIDGVDVYSLRFNPAILQAQDEDSVITGVQIAPGALLTNTALNRVDNTNGTVQFSQLSQGGTSYNGNGKLATIHFKAINAGTSPVTIDFTPGSTFDSNIASEGADVLDSVTNSSISVTTIPNPAPNDLVAPSAPGQFNAKALNYAQVKLSWKAATDAVGVAGYEIFRNGTSLTKIAPAILYYDTAVFPSTAYTYYVKAYDAAGNYSRASGSKTLTTPVVKAASISGIKITQTVAGADIKITWTTSAPTTSSLSYGTVNSLALLTNFLTDPTTGTIHSVTLPGTTYKSATVVYYNIKATLPAPYGTLISNSGIKNFRMK